MISSFFSALTALFNALAAYYDYKRSTDAYERFESQKQKIYKLKETLTNETLCDNPNTAYIERLHAELKREQSYLQYLSTRLPSSGGGQGSSDA